MRLDEYLDFEENQRAQRRRLAVEKDYAILDHLEEFEHRFEEHVSDNTIVGSVSPSIFVGSSGYPKLSTGVLSPVGRETQAAQFETSGQWYDEGVSIADVFERRTSLLNSTRRMDATDVHDSWNGFLGVQREIAIADRPVEVEIDLETGPEIDLDVNRDDIATPTGPRAPAREATLGENPHVPSVIEKTLEDDDWQASGAMTYLYRRGFDICDINTVLSAGALGREGQRRLVPTRWSITAVDDTIGRYLRGQTHSTTSIGQVELHRNEFLGNTFWVILAPGEWEYELVEVKSPGSIWNPDPNAGTYLAAAHEGREGRTGYVDETAGAYYAARLAALEHLANRGSQAKVLVCRHVSDDYWGPVGVWQVRETVRNAFEGNHGTAESFGEAVSAVAGRLPVSPSRLRRKSTMAAGLQTRLDGFDDH